MTSLTGFRLCRHNDDSWVQAADQRCSRAMSSARSRETRAEFLIDVRREERTRLASLNFLRSEDGRDDAEIAAYICHSRMKTRRGPLKVGRYLSPRSLMSARQSVQPI
jgi:hypothetical protein